jgi:hypothetical protein
VGTVQIVFLLVTNNMSTLFVLCDMVLTMDINSKRQQK